MVGREAGRLSEWGSKAVPCSSSPAHTVQRRLVSRAWEQLSWGLFLAQSDVSEEMIWTEPLRAPDATTRMQIHGSQGKRPQAGRAAQGCGVLETGLVCLCRNLFLPFSVSLCLFLVSPVVTQTQP